MKKRLIFALSVLLLVLVPAAVYAATYIGNRNSYKLHYQGCQWERKMSPKNRVVFNDRQEAIELGYVPCKVCKP